MHHDAFTKELARLRVIESGAIGSLKGTVAGVLLREDAGLPIGVKELARLRVALNGAEASHKAIVDHLCKPVELV